MFVIFKNNEGGYSVRPAWIGFIKNNYLRRSLCSLFYPFTICLTIAINLIASLLFCATVLTRAVWIPIARAKPIWKTEIWKRPRSPGENGRMH